MPEGHVYSSSSEGTVGYCPGRAARFLTALWASTGCPAASRAGDAGGPALKGRRTSPTGESSAGPRLRCTTFLAASPEPVAQRA